MPYTFMIWNNKDYEVEIPALGDLFQVTEITPDLLNPHWGKGTFIALEPHDSDEQLRAEPAQARAELARAREELAQARRQLAAPVQRCGYCGYRYSAGTNRENFNVMAEHIKSCPRHPLARALTELAQRDRKHKNNIKMIRVRGQELDRVRANLAQVREEAALLNMVLTDANELHAEVRAELAQARAELAQVHENNEYSTRILRETNDKLAQALMQARAELKDLQETDRKFRQQIRRNRDYWYDKAVAAECECDKWRKEARALETAAKGLRRQLAEAVVAQADAELAVHVHDKACRKLAQAERRLRQEAEQELKQRQRQIDLLSGAELRAHQAEQRAECAKARAALVNEKTAYLLDQLASHTAAHADSYADPNSSWTLLRRAEIKAARKLAAEIRKVLDDNQTRLLKRRLA